LERDREPRVPLALHPGLHSVALTGLARAQLSKFFGVPQWSDRETSHSLSAGLRLFTACLGQLCVYVGKAREKDRMPIGELGNNGQAAAHSFNIAA